MFIYLAKRINICKYLTTTQASLLWLLVCAVIYTLSTTWVRNLDPFRSHLSHFLPLNLNRVVIFIVLPNVLTNFVVSISRDRCIFALVTWFPFIMTETMDTSRSLIGAWMGVQNDKMAFLKWNAKRRKQCITACGLASSKYSNKRSQNEILTHLASADLPLDAGKVLSELKRLDIVYAGASNIKQMAYVLLQHITTSGVLPKLYVCEDPVLTIVGPERSTLAQEAKKVITTHTFGSHCIPYAYRFNEVIQHLWKPRREVRST